MDPTVVQPPVPPQFSDLPEGAELLSVPEYGDVPSGAVVLGGMPNFDNVTSLAEVEAIAAKQREIKKEIADAQLFGAVKGRGEFDPFNTFEDVTGWQFDIGRSDKFSEKLKKFKVKYNAGEIMRIPTDEGMVTVARTSPNAPFRRLGGKGEIAAAIVSPQTAVALGTTVLTGGASLPVAMGAGFLGGMAGSGLNEGIEYGRGYQDSTAPEIAGTIALEGGLNALTEGGGRLLFGAKGNVAQETSEALTELVGAGTEGAIPVLRGQSGHPIKQNVFRFVYQFSPSARRGVRKQQQKFLKVLEENGDTRPYDDTMNNDELSALLEAQAQEVHSAGNLPYQSEGPLRTNAVLETGRKLTAALNKWSVTSKAAVDRLYGEAENVARAADPATGQTAAWDLRDLKTWVADTEVPITGKAKPGLVDADGNVIEDVVVGSSFRNPVLRDATRIIKELDPTVMLHNNFSGLQQLKTLRTRVGDVLSGDVDSVTAEEAKTLYRKLTEVIENPVSGDQTFLNAWRSANDAFKERQAFIKTQQIKMALAEKPAIQVARQFLRPGDPDTLALVRANLKADPKTAPAWDSLKETFVNQFTGSTDNLSSAAKNLDKYSKEELNLLLDTGVENTLRRASVQANQVKNGPIAQLLKTNESSANRLLQLANPKGPGTEAEIEQLLRLSTGGIDSPRAEGLRAAVFQNLLKRSARSSEETGELIVNPSVLNQSLRELQASNRLKGLFREQDWARFKNWEKLTAVIGSTSDAGASIAAGNISSDIAAGPISIAASPGKFMTEVVFKLIGADLMGYYLAKPQSYRALLAASSNNDVKQLLKSATVVNGNILRDLYGQSKVEAGDSNPPIGMQPPAPYETPAPAPVVPEKSGSLQVDPIRQMAQARSAPSVMGSIAPSAPAGKAVSPQQYSALFPNDALGGAIASQQGIASLRG